MSSVIEKFDVKTFLKDINLEENAKPRTLQEIHAEVGFPFTARTVVLDENYVNNEPDIIHALPIGTELTFIDVVGNGEVVDVNGDIFRNANNRPIFKSAQIFRIGDRDRCVVRSDVPRWVLPSATLYPHPFRLGI